MNKQINKIKYKIIVDAILDGVFITRDYKIFYCNEALSKMIGYTPEEMIDAHFLKFIYDDDKKMVSENRRNRLAGKETPTEYEIRLVHKNGNIIYAIISMAPIIYINGIKSTIGTIKDITERIQSELKIQEIEASYKALLELSPDPIVVSDLDGYIIMHNQVAYNIYESPDKNFKLIGKKVADFIFGGNNLNLISNLIENFEDIQGSKYTVNFKTCTGRLIPFEINTNTMYDIQGNPKYRIMSGRDMSKIKNYENELKKLIKEKETMIKEIHHRIKNSLQQVHSLLGLQAQTASTIYTSLSDENKKTDLCQIQLQKIISDARQRILAIAIVHQMFYKESTENVEFSAFLYELVKNIKLTYENGTEIITTITGMNLELCLDYIIPCGLIANEIISNSFKYAFKGKKLGNINIDIQHANSLVTLIIEDDGIGITDGYNKNNQGLGFSLINGLTEQINGNITFTSNENGTKYILTFKDNCAKG